LAGIHRYPSRDMPNLQKKINNQAEKKLVDSRMINNHEEIISMDKYCAGGSQHPNLLLLFI
jgi:hypothetical protein